MRGKGGERREGARRGMAEGEEEEKEKEVEDEICRQKGC